MFDVDVMCGHSLVGFDGDRSASVLWLRFAARLADARLYREEAESYLRLTHYLASNDIEQAIVS